MGNNRIYYAIQQVAMKNASDSVYTAIHGLQNISSSAGFNIVPVNELGKDSISTTLPDGQDIQFSCNKVLDGYPLVYSIVTDNISYVASGILQKSDLAISIFSDNNISATGNALITLLSSGLYITSLRYNFPNNGNFQEEISFAGSNRRWSLDVFNGVFNNNDEPETNVNRRQDMSFWNGSSPINSTLPSEIPSGSHISSISVSTSISYEEVPQLGSIIPSCKIPHLPLETTTEIVVSATGTDSVSTILNAFCVASGFAPQPILLKTCEGTTINLGSGNKLISTSSQGGGIDGGIISYNYTYKTYESSFISHI